MSGSQRNMNEYRIADKLMGCMFELIIAHDNPKEANRLLDAGIAEIRRIEQLLTEFNDTSVTSEINRNAGVSPVRVDQEVYSLLQRSINLSRLTSGAFDITVRPLKKIYDFKNQEFIFPAKNIVREALSLVGYPHLILSDDSTVFLEKKGMSISFAAIGKGYAADRVKKIWLEAGICGGVVNASGDLTVIGKRGDRTPWKVGIADPDTPDKILMYVPLEKGAVATSGDYRQYFVKNGIRYSHNINPKTGVPLTGIKSVSIFSPGAELCDALATAVYVMGTDSGLFFVDQLPETHCIIIDDRDRIHKSSNLDIMYEK